jgi:alkanesulfonate monooxygenase SsuD/methylene tetrahydromethanopterin reductase-like flavin-dependent oxidoreductase (luciferase family)
MVALGVFMMPLHPPARDLTTVLEEDRDLVKLADRLGYAEAWMGEHYTSTGEPVTSPLLFNASLIAETRRIVFGTGVISLPQQHPVVVAGHVALFDHLSRGRTIFGIGSGGLSCDWEVFGNLDGKARGLAMVESIELILKLWTEDPPFRHDGTYFQVSLEDRIIPELGVGRLIRPYQKPYPPIAVSLRAANSYTARQAGMRGWIPVSGNFIPVADIATHWPTYVAGADEAGRQADPSLWRVGRSVLVTETDAEAEEILADPDGVFTRYYTYLNVHGRMAGGDLSKDIDWATARVEAQKTARALVIAGSAKTVLDRLVEFRDAIGDFGTLMVTGHDMEGARALWMRSFARIAEEVGPKLTAYMDAKRHPAAAD